MDKAPASETPAAAPPPIQPGKSDSTKMQINATATIHHLPIPELVALLARMSWAPIGIGKCQVVPLPSVSSLSGAIRNAPETSLVIGSRGTMKPTGAIPPQSPSGACKLLVKDTEASMVVQTFPDAQMG